MTETKIVPLKDSMTLSIPGEADPDILEAVDQLAGRTKRGEVRAIAVVTIDPAGRGHFHLNAGNLPYAQFLGHVTALWRDAMDDWGQIPGPKEPHDEGTDDAG